MANVGPEHSTRHAYRAWWYALLLRQVGGGKEFLFYSEWKDGRVGMAKAARELLVEADAVVTYNGDKYDLPKITGEIMLAGLSPPPPVASIDLIKAVKKFGYNMNRLAYIGPLLGLGGKVKHQGFNLWKEVMAGDVKAQKTMERYCIQDVRLTEKLYHKVKPFIRNHPHLGVVDTSAQSVTVRSLRSEASALPAATRFSRTLVTTAATGLKPQGQRSSDGRVLQKSAD